MKRIEIVTRLLLSQTVNTLISQYQYKSVVVNKVNGIFLENRSNEWTLIRIMDETFDNIEENKPKNHHRRHTSNPV